MWQEEYVNIEEQIKNTSNLKKQLETDFISIGQLLSEQKRYKVFVHRGYKTFAEFVENEYNMSRSMANKLISTYELYIDNLDKDEETVKGIGLDKLTMIKPFVEQANFQEAEEWIEKAQNMPTAQLQEEIKEIREQKKLANKTMKDILIEQHIEKMVTFFNCGRKALDFKMALYFGVMDMESVRATIRTEQHKFEEGQIMSQEDLS